MFELPENRVPMGIPIWCWINIFPQFPSLTPTTTEAWSPMSIATQLPSAPVESTGRRHCNCCRRCKRVPGRPAGRAPNRHKVAGKSGEHNRVTWDCRSFALWIMNCGEPWKLATDPWPTILSDVLKNTQKRPSTDSVQVAWKPTSSPTVLPSAAAPGAGLCSC